MKRIFIDVGAHPSWTVDAALLPEFKIDEAFLFDPSPKHHSILKEKYWKDSRVHIVKSGMWKKSCTRTLYNEGSIGGSIFEDFKTSMPNGVAVQCSFVGASDWFAKHINKEDFVVLKLNCEASECDILENLMDSGEYKKIDIALVDFDVTRTPSQSHRKNDIIEKAKSVGFTGMKIWPGGRNQKRRMICDTLTFFKDDLR